MCNALAVLPALSFLEPIFFSFIKQIRLRTPEVDNLRTAVSLQDSNGSQYTIYSAALGEQHAYNLQPSNRAPEAR